MEDSTGKVAKLVQQKLEDYFNRQRVENEFDPSGKGIHTTTPLVVQLELSYLQAAEKQWKATRNAKHKTHETHTGEKEVQARDGEKSNKESDSATEVSPTVIKNSRTKAKTKGSKARDGEQSNGGSDSATEVSPRVTTNSGTKARTKGSKARDGGKSNGGSDSATEVSPRVTKNSKIKARTKGSEIDRITKNAQTTLNQISVDKVHSIHRYRPHLVPKEYLDLGKVAHISHHVNAILNTEHAWQCAEQYDGREAARKYVEEKNESEETDHQDESQMTASTGSQQRKVPLWLRVEMQKAKHESQSNWDSVGREETKQESRDEDASDILDEVETTSRQDKEAETKKEAAGENEAQGEDARNDMKERCQEQAVGDTKGGNTDVTGIDDEGKDDQEHGRSTAGDDVKYPSHTENGGENNEDGSKTEIKDKQDTVERKLSDLSDHSDRNECGSKENEHILGNSDSTSKDFNSQQINDSQRDKHDHKNSESEKQDDENKDVTGSMKEESGDVQDARADGEGDCGEECENKDKGKVGGGDGQEEANSEAQKDGGSPREVQGVLVNQEEGAAVSQEQDRLEEYVRAESMVSLTAVVNDNE